MSRTAGRHFNITLSSQIARNLISLRRLLLVSDGKTGKGCLRKLFQDGWAKFGLHITPIFINFSMGSYKDNRE